MDIKKKLQDFNKRWDIKESIDYEEEFQKFKNRIINIFKDIDDHVSDEGITLFCNILGIQRELYETNIINKLENENNQLEFYRLLEIIFYIPPQNFKSYYHGKKVLIKKLSEIIDLSYVNLELFIKENGEIILYPQGEKELDQKLVNEVLRFLNEKSQEHFINALKFYRSHNYIKTAESLRRSLEEFLRFKLNNQKGLKENIKELSKKLKKDESDPSVRNIIFQTFSYLDTYFDENSKHKDGNIDEAEAEFLIYQSGLLMRYIYKEILK